MHPDGFIIWEIALDEGIREVDGCGDPLQDNRYDQESTYRWPGCYRTVVGFSVVILKISSETDPAFELPYRTVAGSLDSEHPFVGYYLCSGIRLEVLFPGSFLSESIDLFLSCF